MILLPSTTDTGAGTFVTAGTHIDKGTSYAEVLLNVTSAAAAAGDTLDVFVQTSNDNGATWDDLIHFTQVLGNGGAKKFYARWQGQLTPTAATGAPQDGTLAANTVVQGPKSTFWRVKRVVVSATAAVFTLTVTASGNGTRIVP